MVRLLYHLSFLFGLLLVACNDVYSEFGDSIHYMEVRASFADSQTKLLTENLQVDDVIGVSTLQVDNQTTHMNPYSNIKYHVRQHKSGQLYMSTFDPKILNDQPCNVSAYYPYQQASNPKNLYIESGDGVDYISGIATNVTASNPFANIQLNHMKAIIRLSIILGNYQGAGVIDRISLQSNQIAQAGYYDTFLQLFNNYVGINTPVVLDTNFTLSAMAHVEEFDIVSTGQSNSLMISMVVDGKTFSMKLPAFRIDAGQIYTISLTANEATFDFSRLIVGDNPVSSTGEQTIPVGDFSLKLSGNLTSLAFRTDVDGSSASVTVKLLKQSVNEIPASPTLNGTAVMRQSLSSDRLTRTITLTNISSDVTLTFDGVATQLPVSSVTANGAYYLTADNYGSDKWEYGATDVFVVGKSRRYVVEPTNAGSSTVGWGGYLSNKSCADYSKADGSNSSITLSTSADPSSWTGGAISEFAGYTNSGYITGIDIGKALVNFRNSSGNNSWFIPSCGEMALLYLYKTKVNEALGKLGGVALEDADYWTSTERDARSAWHINLSSGKVDNTGKLNKKKRRYLREI